MADPQKSGPRKPSTPARTPTYAQWSKTFLSHLAETSNVSASAKQAGISKTTAYDKRRKDAEFNRKWQEALFEGYQHLEMETLQRLRDGEVKQKRDAQRGNRVFDNGNAIRLLLAHRQSAARQEAIRDNRDADAILASIDAKLDRMRERAMQQAKREAAAKAKDDGQ
jgi:hypothetical protein